MDENDTNLKTGDTSGEEKTEVEEEKPQLTEAQILGIKKRQLTKLANELGVELPKPEPEKAVEKKEGFDNADKAYLIASGVKRDEFDLVARVMKSTGAETLDEVLEDDVFQLKLKSEREKKATQIATPEGTKRAQPSARDEVGYWLERGELPPKGETELRRKVVNAKIDREKQGQKFTNRPIVIRTDQGDQRV